MAKAFELLVFDWDGTLMDSAAAIAEALQAACSTLGLQVPTAEQARYVIGLGLADAMQYLLPDLAPGDYGRVVEQYRIEFLRRDGGTTLFPGVADMLGELRESGVLLAVATGKSRRGLDRALAATGIGPLFDFTRCADEGFAKPHPGMLQAVMDGLAVPAEATLMIGDTTHDLEMAQAAGVAAVGVAYGAHPRDALLRLPALAVLDQPPQLREWFRRQLALQSA